MDINANKVIEIMANQLKQANYDLAVKIAEVEQYKELVNELKTKKEIEND